MLQRTPFHALHVVAGARLVDFAGWEMPLVYRGIVQEHVHTRQSGSFFDVSHMGRLRLDDGEAAALLEEALTRRIGDMAVGQSRYSLVCNESGGVLDDVIVSRDAGSWLVVCNACNRLKLLSHLGALAGGRDVRIDDQTTTTAMVALQGPQVVPKLAEVLEIDFDQLKRYRFETTQVMLVNLTVFRSGYTGEDGVEIILPARMAAGAAEALAGKMTDPDATIKPAGLGARDTLRLEAGMPLYGHELGEGIDPISAGLAWAVDLSKPSIGSASLRLIANRGPARKLVGLELEGKRIARQDTPVCSGPTVVGQVTSGTFSPTLGRSIAMAYVDAACAAEGTPLSVELKGAAIGANVVQLPFYKRRRN